MLPPPPELLPPHAAMQTPGRRQQAANENKHLVTPILNTRPAAESAIIVVSLPVPWSRGDLEESKAARVYVQALA